MAANGGKRAKSVRESREAKGGLRLRPEVAERLMEAERVVEERMGPLQALDEMVEDFLEGFREQFIQTRFDMEKEDELINDPYVTLAIYGQIRAAIDHFIANEIRQRGLDLTQDEVDFYLRRLRPE